MRNRELFGCIVELCLTVLILFIILETIELLYTCIVTHKNMCIWFEQGSGRLEVQLSTPRPSFNDVVKEAPAKGAPVPVDFGLNWRPYRQNHVALFLSIHMHYLPGLQRS
jgi:hypothetical protein